MGALKGSQITAVTVILTVPTTPYYQLLPRIKTMQTILPLQQLTLYLKTLFYLILQHPWTIFQHQSSTPSSPIHKHYNVQETPESLGRPLLYQFYEPVVFLCNLGPRGVSVVFGLVEGVRGEV